MSLKFFKPQSIFVLLIFFCASVLSDGRIDLAKRMYKNSHNTQLSPQQPKNTPSSHNVPYCQTAPRNSELVGYFQCQFQNGNTFDKPRTTRKHRRDGRIDLARRMYSNGGHITQPSPQQPRNKPSSMGAPYIEKPPRNPELIGYFQAQFQGANPSVGGHRPGITRKHRRDRIDLAKRTYSNGHITQFSPQQPRNPPSLMGGSNYQTAPRNALRGANPNAKIVEHGTYQR